ncbi:H-NS family nucleoid-associated regulatory protein [Yoonia sp. R2-816]|uniref:H-NS histone family protein n=1 Tax=Yoonia sp. R2-816 TaxID=3342638 RepID=UPI00372B060B
MTKTARKTAKKPKKASIPKYANPDDRTQTWTGKGRKPEWFKAAMAAGKTPEQCEI